MDHTGNESAKDLTIFEDPKKKYLREVARTLKAFASVRSFKDYEALMLRGQGLAGKTYEKYMLAVKRFYEFSEITRPDQIGPGHLEMYYDHAVKRGGVDAARWDMTALKKLFEGIEKQYPLVKSPFEDMSKETRRKILRSKRGNRTLDALTVEETQEIVDYLKLKRTPEGLRDCALYWMLATSGLRSAELLQIRYKGIVERPSGVVALFVGKGGRDDEQELYKPALVKAKEYFRTSIGRAPQADDSLFHGEPFKLLRPLSYSALWDRIKAIGEDLKREGIIERAVNFSPHMLRRTYATTLYESGMGIKAIQKKTRHKSLDTLLKHYIIDNEPAEGYLDKIYSVA